MAMIIISWLMIGLMLAVMWLDATRFLIPNWLVGLVLLLYVPYLIFIPEMIAWKGALGIMVLTFAVGVVLFAANVMGGGDVKLLAACGLWVGLDAGLSFMLITAIAGGLLALVLMIGRPVMSYLWLRVDDSRQLPEILRKGAPLPYGVAIAFAMIVLTYQSHIPFLNLGVSS